MVNKKTWYAHMFRTQGGDFGFPYPMSGSQQKRAKSFARDLFFNNNWPKQVRPLSWLVDKFWPVKGWTEEDLARLKANTFKFEDSKLGTKPAESEPVEDKPSKGIIFYTDNQLKLKIARTVQNQLRKISKTTHIPIISSSLKPMPNFGNKNIHFPSLKKGYLTMFKQILGALENSIADIIFFCEHDVLYHPSHFDFIPPKKDAYYFNLNVWKLDANTGHALKVDDCKQTSGLCAYRELLVGHYRRRIKKILQNQKDMLANTGKIKNEGFSRYMGFEPGCHSVPRGVDNYKALSWVSELPNIDIRHSVNLTPNRWRKDQFRNQKYTKGWTESNKIPGWGKTIDLIKKF